VYLIAGMNRSGSTWLFNAVRLLLARAGAPDLAAGWVDDRAELLRHRTPVLKVHAFDPDLMARRWPCAVLVSHRDPRDVVASMARKFGCEPTADLARHIMGEYWRWARHALYDMRYETMMADGPGEVARVARALGLRDVDCAAVLADINALGSDAATQPPTTAADGFDRTSLLHPGHVTDGRHGSWRDQLPPDVAEQIELEFAEWMERRGYDRSPAAPARPVPVSQPH
jgi:hypothetical protein